MASLIAPSLKRQLALEMLNSSGEGSLEARLIPIHNAKDLIPYPHDLKANHDVLWQIYNQIHWATPSLHYLSAVLVVVGVMLGGDPASTHEPCSMYASGLLWTRCQVPMR